MSHDALRSFRAHSRTMVRELGFLQEEWAPAGISHPQVHAMLELATAGVLQPSELAEILRSDPAIISRSVKGLLAKGLISAKPDPADRRRRQLSLTEAGHAVVRGIHADADSQVRQALAVIDPRSRDSVFEGMAAYAKALRRSRQQKDLRVREIRPSDNPAVTALIRTVMPEFGASGPGFAIMDPEVDGMFEAYQAHRSTYWVVLREGNVVGAGGYAPLVGGDGTVAEVRKMYFLPELRGMGMGAKLLDMVLNAARAEGFATCYLETLEHMTRARRLYESFGFVPLEAPMGNTGHGGCNAWYARPLH